MSKPQLENIRSAMEKGWNVRLCFDPVLPGWEELVSYVKDFIDPAKSYDVSVGGLRMFGKPETNLKDIKQEELKQEEIKSVAALLEKEGFRRVHYANQ